MATKPKLATWLSSNPEKTSFDATSEIGKREKEKESSRIRDPVQMNLEAVAEQQNEVEFLLGFQVLRQVALFALRAFDATNWHRLPPWWKVAALKDLGDALANLDEKAFEAAIREQIPSARLVRLAVPAAYAELPP